MYHEVTYEELSRRRRMRLIGAVVALVLVALVVAGALVSHRVTRAQGATSVRAAVLEAAIQCCAVEGSYPSALSHLENDYGLVVNHSDYVVTYEWLGDNVMPSVAVRLR